MICCLIVHLADYERYIIYEVTVHNLKVRTGPGVRNTEVDKLNPGRIVKFNTFTKLAPS